MKKIELNKVDLEIKRCLLAYPTLYRNRFDVMDHILTTNGNGYHWNNKGELVKLNQCDKEDETFDKLRQKGLNHLEEQVEKAKKQIQDNSPINLSFWISKRAELEYAKFVADHIDIYATTYCGVEYRDTWRWLYRSHHRGDWNYWAITNKKFNSCEEVDPDWQEAIREWLRMKIIPAANGIMGIISEETHRFLPQKGYEKFFNFLYQQMEWWTTDKQRESDKRISQDISKRIDKIMKQTAQR
jgi:hypothetical protein